MIEFKTGVRLNDLAPQMVLAIIIAEQCFDIYKLPCVVTSCNDGQHMEGSLHRTGRAVDLRTKNAPGVAKGIFQLLRAKLGPVGYDVLFEYLGGDNEHIHIEYDPKV